MLLFLLSNHSVKIETALARQSPELHAASAVVREVGVRHLGGNAVIARGDVASACAHCRKHDKPPDSESGRVPARGSRLDKRLTAEDRRRLAEAETLCRDLLVRLGVDPADILGEARLTRDA